MVDCAILIFAGFNKYTKKVPPKFLSYLFHQICSALARKNGRFTKKHNYYLTRLSYCFLLLMVFADGENGWPMFNLTYEMHSLHDNHTVVEGLNYAQLGDCSHNGLPVLHQLSQR